MSENEDNSGPALVIVAAYPSVRAGLHALLRAEAPTLLILEEAESGAELDGLLADIRPDVVLLDTTGEEGSAVSQTLSGLARAGRSSEVGLLVLGDRPESDLTILASADGLPGFGYLLRSEADGTQISTAIRTVADGLMALDRSLAKFLLPPSEPSAPSVPMLTGVATSIPGETLTPREIEVLQKMAEGLPNKQIGTKLGISLHTVKFHVAQILGKLNATSRTEAVTIGARRGYVLF